ncbi:hypothetical protein NE237_026405 [Protea cynaroides]|uniref:Reverse transcriptase/retrotransposon-derived protein RNase H-like domain-containing protein n=1 Tax=Protea cynaroides TaxID=273540 RepID=A0A9Q0H4Y7_9MAGN|nr:hypothetical protein NE237_026405 [Protea cynaroides]
MVRPNISRVLSDEGSDLEARLDRLEATMANGDKKIAECFDSIEMLKSAMKIALDGGLKKGEITNVASLREEEDIGPKKAQPQEIEAVLDEYKDIIPNELPKKLPPQRERAFDDLKKAVIEEHVMTLPDHTKPFEVQTDASDFAIGGVLMQDDHPITYESRKLNEIERRYTV